MQTDSQSLVYRSGDAFLPARIRQFLRTYLVGGPTSTFYLNYWPASHKYLTCGILVYILFEPLFSE
jgi:hypothetical protein